MRLMEFNSINSNNELRSKKQKNQSPKLNILEYSKELQKNRNCKEEFCSCYNCCKSKRFENVCKHGQCTSCCNCYCYILPPCQVASNSQADSNSQMGSTIQITPTLNTGPNFQTGPTNQISPTLDTGSTLQTGTTNVISPILDTGPFVQTGSTNQISPTLDTGHVLQTGTTNQISPVLDVGPFIQTGTTNQISPTLDTGPVFQTGTTNQVSPTLDTGPVLQTGTTNQISPTIDTGSVFQTGTTNQIRPTLNTGSVFQTGTTKQISPKTDTGTTGTAKTTRLAEYGSSQGLSEYAYIFNFLSQTITAEKNIAFSNNGIITSGISHTPGTDVISLINAGQYLIYFYVLGVRTNQFTIYHNNSPVLGSTYSSMSATQPIQGMVIITASAGDYIVLKNSSSATAVMLKSSADGILSNVNASILIQKIG